jgi:hypothetical protein
VRQYLREHPELAQQLDRSLRETLLATKGRAGAVLEPDLAAD